MSDQTRASRESVLEFYATAAKGTEDLLADELRSSQIGARDVEIGRGGVSFCGTLETAYRTCLHSRVAIRVLYPIHAFSAPNPEKLYGGVKAIRWSDHLTPEQTLAVEFVSVESQITHTHYGALKVKDAVCDQLRSVFGERPSVSRDRPDVSIYVYLFEDWATVSLDLSGESLHKRGYRDDGAPAPLKETLAAALLLRAGWDKIGPQGAAFLDPMCGSGTLVHEATSIAIGAAPGVHRDYFGFLGWKQHDRALWQKLKQEARGMILPEAIGATQAGEKRPPRIMGSDRNVRVIESSRNNLSNTVWARWSAVKFDCQPLITCPTPAASLPQGYEGPQGFFFLNPPYGERIGALSDRRGARTDETEEDQHESDEALFALYRQIGDTMKQRFRGWKGFIFTGNPDAAKCIGLKASRRHIFYNGPIECRLLEFDLY